MTSRDSTDRLLAGPVEATADAGVPGRIAPRSPFPPAAGVPGGHPRLGACAVVPTFEGEAHVALSLVEPERTRVVVARLPLSGTVEGASVRHPTSGKLLRFAPAEILEALCSGYDVEREVRRAAARPAAGKPVQVAFTLRASTVRGGGPATVFRYVNWLADMGVEVSVYSDDHPPSWLAVNARFHRIPDAPERYAAITEPLVIVYSVLEVPILLRHASTAGKRIYHLCQGAEDFHFGPPDPGGLLARSTAFDLLNAIPVGRLVVSPHLQRYFAEKYDQRSLLVTNGVDLDLFTPGPPRRPDGRIRVLCVGNPSQPLKGYGAVLAALTELARRHPDWRLHLVNACGESPTTPIPEAGPGFTGERLVGVSGPGMRELYRAADAYVNASWYEGFGLPSLEAMACGTPVVQCRNHGLDGIVEDGRDCLEASAGSPPSIADALERILTDAPLRARLTRGGLETASRHSLHQQRRALVAAFSSLTGQDLPSRDASAPEGGPRVSLVLPVFGAAPWVGAALEDLRGQTEVRWEALVVHHGEDAGAGAALDGVVRGDERVKVINLPGATLAVALAASLARARAPWIGWLRPEDRLLREALALLLEPTRADVGLRVVVSGLEDPAKEAPGHVPSASPETGAALAPLDLLRPGAVDGAFGLLHRHVHEVLGGFGDGPPEALAATMWLRASLRFRPHQVPAGVLAAPAIRRVAHWPADPTAAGRALGALLRPLDFPALFPHLGLTQPEQATRALELTARLAAALARVHGGPLVQAPLLELASSWLARRARPRVREAGRTALRLLGDQAEQPELLDAVAVLLTPPASRPPSKPATTQAEPALAPSSALAPAGVPAARPAPIGPAAAPTAMPVLSVVLAVRDGWAHTHRALLALVEATRGLPCETIVVDDGSSDETARALPLLPGLLAVRSDRPQGLARARRQGADLATGRLIAFLGNGAFPTEAWIRPILAALELDPDLAAARPASDPLAADGLVVRADACRRVGGLDPAFGDRLAELDLSLRLEDLGLPPLPVQGSHLEVRSPWGVGLPPSPADEQLLVARWGRRLAAAAATPGTATAARAEARAEIRPGRAPRFSVLVPCYNQAHFLTAALDSLLAQTCPDWEALVVDDGSSDGTSEVAERYARRDPRFRPFRKPNGGVASALNRGLAEARGEWVCWLSADDLFLPGKLAAHLAAIEDDPGLRFMHTGFEVLFQETGRRAASGVDPATFIPPLEEQVIRLLRINYLNGITIALHRSVFEQVGGFDEAFRYGQDHDMWLRASALVRSRYLAAATAVTRLHPGQGTALFTEAGIYDSARAAAAFLNGRPLAALFPALDLSRPDHGLRAVVEAIRVAVYQASFVTRCGLAPLLLDRIHEWIAQAAQPVRALVHRELARAAAAPGVEPAVAEVVRAILAVAPGDAAFVALDPLELMARQALRVEARGDEKEVAALRRYLAMVADTRARGLEARTP